MSKSMTKIDRDDTGQLAAPFNAGCDSRIRGVPRDANPHPRGTASRAAWLAGWDDVDAHWGADARGLVAALPRAARRSWGGS